MDADTVLITNFKTMKTTENRIQNLVSGALAVMFGVAIYFIVVKQTEKMQGKSSACGCGN